MCVTYKEHIVYVYYVYMVYELVLPGEYNSHDEDLFAVRLSFERKTTFTTLIYLVTQCREINRWALNLVLK